MKIRNEVMRNVETPLKLENKWVPGTRVLPAAKRD